jgi:hypothetical protein
MAAPVQMALPVAIGSMGRPKVSVPQKQTQVPPTAVSKLHYVPPNAGVASSAWTSSGTFLDFELPKSFSVINKTTLQFEINVGGNEASRVPPSPFLIQQIEVYVGSQLLETLYPNDIYNESIGFLNFDEMLAESPSLAYNPGKFIDTQFAGALGNYGSQMTALSSVEPAPGAHITTLPTGKNYLYLPFNNCLATCGFCCSGLTEAVKFRVYFPSSMFQSGDDVSLATANLILEEDVGTSLDRRAWDIASNAGLVYSTVVRQRMNTIIQKGASDYTLELTGLNGSSAGFLIYAGPPVNAGSGNTAWVPFTGDASGVNVPNNALVSTRYAIDTLELDDQVGNKRTETLRGEHLLNFVWPRQIGSSFTQRPDSQTYLLPFCVDFRDVLKNGVYQGHLRTNGRDRLVIGGTPHNSGMSTDNWSITVVNYAYTGLVVRNGKLVEILRNPHAGDFF